VYIFVQIRSEISRGRVDQSLRAKVFFPSPDMSAILREIVELSNPAPKEFDPEDIVPDFEASESEEDEVEAGREHYVQVG
jgi:hypothetical protein